MATGSNWPSAHFLAFRLRPAGRRRPARAPGGTPFARSRSRSWRTTRSRRRGVFGRSGTGSGSPRPPTSSSGIAVSVSRWWRSARGTPRTAPAIWGNSSRSSSGRSSRPRRGWRSASPANIRRSSARSTWAARTARSARTSSSASGAARSPNRTGWKCWSTNWGTTWGRSIRRRAARSCAPTSATGSPAARSFHIGFDAPNTLAMYLVGEELRSGAGRPVHLGQLPPATKDRLRGVYRSLAAALPKDPAAPAYLAMLDQSLGLAGEPSEHRPSRDRRRDRGAGGDRGRREEPSDCPKKLPSPSGKAAKIRRCRRRQAGWRPADRILRAPGRRGRPAAAPGRSPARRFCWGWGWRWTIRPCCRTHRSSARSGGRSSRPRSGRRGWRCSERRPCAARHDLAQHFAVSAALAVLVGPQGAEGSESSRELTDSRSGSGFSFADLRPIWPASCSPAPFATGRIPLSRLEDGFAVRGFSARAERTEEGIAWDDFVQQLRLSAGPAAVLGSGSRFERRILALPGHQ